MILMLHSRTQAIGAMVGFFGRRGKRVLYGHVSGLLHPPALPALREKDCIRFQEDGMQMRRL
jgi:hypothetical protein